MYRTLRIAVLLLLSISGTFVLAEDTNASTDALPLTQPYTDADLDLSFRHPAGWLPVPLGPDGVGLLNTEDDSVLSAEEIPDGIVGVEVIPDAEAILNLDPADSLTDLLLSVDPVPADAEPTAFTLADGRDAAEVAFVLGEERGGVALYVLATTLGERTLVLRASSNLPEDLDALRSTLHAIAISASPALTETFATLDGEITLRHPADWSAEGQSVGASVFNTADADLIEALYDGEVIEGVLDITLFTDPIDALQLDEGLSLVEIAVGIPGTPDGTEVVSITLPDGREAAQTRFEIDGVQAYALVTELDSAPFLLAAAAWDAATVDNSIGTVWAILATLNDPLDAESAEGESMDAETAAEPVNRYEGLTSSRGTDGAFILGNPDAPITLVIFSDYACPSCQAYNATVLDFIDTFVVAQQAALEFRVLPTAGGDDTRFAGQLAECAEAQRSGAFWEAKDYLYETAERQAGLGSLTVESFAAALDLDADLLVACQSDADQVNVDEALAASEGVRATPTVLLRYAGDDTLTPIDGGDRSLDALRALVEAAQ